MSKPQIWQDFLLASLSGILLMFSWHNIFNPGISLWPGAVAFIAFIPFIHIWRHTGWRGNFVFAWWMGFIYFLGILFWLRYISRDTNIDNTIAWIIFSFLGGCYFGLFGATTSFVKSKLKLPYGLILALGWVGWEYIRGHFITGGWPWGSLGHTQYANPVTRQIAAVAGVGGLSFIIIIINVFILEIIQKITKKELILSKINIFSRKNINKYKKTPIITLVITFFIILWSVLLIINIAEMIKFKNLPKAEIKVALIQGNINTDQSWNIEYRNKVMKKMRKLHLEAASKKPYLIVWAESCFPGILEYFPYFKWEQELKDLIREGNIPTLLTSNEYVPSKNLIGQKYHHYNSAFLLGKNGEISGRYRKIKLVPAGEYIPWNWMKLFMHAVVREPIPQDFEPGTDYTPLNIGRLRFSPLICYETHSEELAYQLAGRDPHFFAALSNDGWSGENSMGLQQTTMAVFLAVEHRMSIAKAEMTGPTCVIDGWGNMSKSIPYFKEGVQTVTVKVANFKPFFTHFGNIIPLFFTILFFLLFFLAIISAVFKKN